MMLIYSGIAILVSLFLSWTEIKYWMFAKSATANVVDLQIVEYRGRRRRYDKLEVSFRYTDEEGMTKSEKDEVSLNYDLPLDDTVGIQYFSGVEDSARLVGSGKAWPFFVVIGSFSYFAFVVWKFAKEANTPIARGPRLRR